MNPANRTQHRLYITAVHHANVKTDKIYCTPNEHELRLFYLPNIYRQKERKLVVFISLQVLSIPLCKLCENLVDHTYFTHVDLYIHPLPHKSSWRSPSS
jgi:hypothetical protein